MTTTSRRCDPNPDPNPDLNPHAVVALARVRVEGRWGREPSAERVPHPRAHRPYPSRPAHHRSRETPRVHPAQPDVGRKPCLWAARLDCERKPVLGLALALTLTLTLTRRAPSTLCCGCEAARRSRRVRHMRAFLLGAECGFVVCGSCSTG